MSDPQTPATEAGRELAAEYPNLTYGLLVKRISAIEAEARADAEQDRDAAYSHGYGDGMERGRADALREVAERVRAHIADIAAAMPWYDDANPDYAEAIAAVLAILDPSD